MYIRDLSMQHLQAVGVKIKYGNANSPGSMPVLVNKGYHMEGSEEGCKRLTLDWWKDSLCLFQKLELFHSFQFLKYCFAMLYFWMCCSFAVSSTFQQTLFSPSSDLAVSVAS